MTLRKTKPVILVALPDVIISDLKVVRRRFPQIAVIAISGEYNGPTPAGLIADAFLTKGAYPPEQLFEKIAGHRAVANPTIYQNGQSASVGSKE
jgi:hypothetical protein